MKIYLTKADIMAEHWEKNPSRGVYGCVYLIINKADGQIIYAGQTLNPKQRLCPSTHPVYKRDRHDLFILRIDNETERKNMEARCIEVLKPPMNQRLGTERYDKETRTAYLDACYDLVFGKR